MSQSDDTLAAARAGSARAFESHARDLKRFFLVEAQDAGVGDGRAHDGHVQHLGQLDVIDIVALTLDEARIFLAQAGLAHAHQGFFTVTHWCVHACLLGVRQSLRGDGGFMQGAG